MITVIVVIFIIRLIKQLLDDETIVAKVLEKHPGLAKRERELRKAIRAIRRVLED